MSVPGRTLSGDDLALVRALMAQHPDWHRTALVPLCPALTRRDGLYDSVAMSDTLTIRLPAEEKAQWEKAAAEVRETVAEYVRKAVRQRTQSSGTSPWEKHLGAADVAVAAPTNANIRRAFAERRRPKP
jgi:hypothetical protein